MSNNLAIDDLVANESNQKQIKRWPKRNHANAETMFSTSRNTIRHGFHGMGSNP
jgi:hypothetical protein